MAVRQQQRRGTAAQWTAANPILSAAEIGFEIDTNKFKIGDGINRWADLVYFTADAAAALNDLIDGAPDLLNTLNELASAIGDDSNFFTTVASDIATAKSDAETTAANALSSHASDTTNIHGISDTSVLITQTDLANAITGATVDQASLAGTGLDWNSISEQFDIDSTVATKTYVDGKASDAQSSAESFATSADSTLHTTITSEIATAKSQAISTAEGYTDTAISNLINAAPSTLDTLKEIADALAADESTASALATTVATKAPINSPTFTGNVSGITKTMVGLNNVDNTTDLNKPVSNATQSELDLKAPINSPTFIGTVSGITKSMVGLAHVDNTADSEKPVSTAQSAANDQVLLDAKSYTDTSVSNLISGAPLALNTLNELAEALGNDANYASTITNALALKAPIASPTFTGTVSGVTKSMVGLGNVDNTSDASKPISTATQNALNLKATLASPTLTGTPTAPTASYSTNTTQLATTAFVKSVLENIDSLNLVLDGGGVNQ